MPQSGKGLSLRECHSTPYTVKNEESGKTIRYNSAHYTAVDFPGNKYA